MGRLLGPRGNSLKRVEASTGCRVYIRGKGSIKDPGKVKILEHRIDLSPICNIIFRVGKKLGFLGHLTLYCETCLSSGPEFFISFSLI